MERDTVVRIVIIAIVFKVLKKKYKAGHSRPVQKRIDKDATIVDISSKISRFGKKVAEYKTVVTFSDGFQYVSDKSKYGKGTLAFTYSVYIDNELEQEIINAAKESHYDAYCRQRDKDFKETVRRGQAGLFESDNSVRKEKNEAIQRDKAAHDLVMERIEAKKKRGELIDIEQFAADISKAGSIMDIWDIWQQYDFDESYSDVDEFIQEAKAIEQKYGKSSYRVKERASRIIELLKAHDHSGDASGED